MSDAVLLEKVGKTAVITLNRPQKKNALDHAICQALPEVLRSVRTDRTVRSVVLTGAGGAFCSGFDLGGPVEGDDPAFVGRDVVLDFHRWLRELQDLEKPVIAAVDGAAAGAGFSIALMADFVFVTPQTRLQSSFLCLGLVPDLSLLYVLPRLVGLAKAKEILFSARPIGAQEALELGLAQLQVPAERLLERALDYARQFDDAPPQALGLVKTLLNRSFESDRETMTQFEAMAQSLCVGSQYNSEAVQRFHNKQGPLFRGAMPLSS